MGTKGNMKRRYELLPQMREYDRMTFEWMAYVMYTNSRGFRSKVCNTDEHGFRYTLRGESYLSYEDFQSCTGPKGLFCGGSAAFGVGTTNDKLTIPSLINARSDATWFNFGVRASNSTQELLLFQFYLPRVEKVALYSGVNNLVAHMGSAYFAPPFGSFCEDHLFYLLSTRMSAKQAIREILPKSTRAWIRDWFGTLLHSEPKHASTTDFEARYLASMKIVERDMEVWRILRDGRGFSLCYILQPLFPWTKRRPCPEEQELFEILDVLGGPRWQTMSSLIDDNYERYSADLAELCRSKGIDYVDVNNVVPEDGWIFCDRAHLTDQGSMAMANAIAPAIQ